MKKLFVLIMAMIMSFTLVACGGNNDENNAAMQAKIDEADSLLQDICNWYGDKGYLEGESATQIQPIVDKLTGQMDEMKASHQEILDAGGYNDKAVVPMTEALDAVIAKYKEVKEEQKAFDDSAAAGTGIGALTEKYNEVADIVNAASAKALENGWENDEAFNSELTAAFATLEVVSADIQNPDTMDEEYMNELVIIFDEMIPVWQDYLTQVSEPYVAN